jgi:hypothetical protein
MIRSDLGNQWPSDRNCFIPRKMRPQLDIPFPRSFRGSPQTDQSALLCSGALQWACQLARGSHRAISDCVHAGMSRRRRRNSRLATDRDANCDRNCKMRIFATRRRRFAPRCLRRKIPEQPPYEQPPKVIFSESGSRNPHCMMTGGPQIHRE